jgi:hypothetical protein
MERSSSDWRASSRRPGFAGPSAIASAAQTDSANDFALKRDEDEPERRRAAAEVA